MYTVRFTASAYWRCRASVLLRRLEEPSPEPCKVASHVSPCCLHVKGG